MNRPYLPTRDNVLVRIPEIKKTHDLEGADGRSFQLYLPRQVTANAEAETHEGVVVDTGPQCSGEIQLGDDIAFTQHSEHRINIDGVRHVIVTENNILFRRAALPASTTSRE